MFIHVNTGWRLTQLARARPKIASTPTSRVGATGGLSSRVVQSVSQSVSFGQGEVSDVHCGINGIGDGDNTELFDGTIK